MTPEQRSLKSRIAAHTLHAQGKTNTAPARAAADKRFLDQVDPDRVLPEAERLRRADHARKAYFTKLAFRSSQARKKAG